MIRKAAVATVSVFAGGWTLDAASNLRRRGSRETGVLDLLTSLTDKSLVLRSKRRDYRYRLLETVRQYAQNRLLESEVDPRFGPTSRLLLALARSGAEIAGTEQLEWLQRRKWT
jgi:predicted ATPase